MAFDTVLFSDIHM